MTDCGRCIHPRHDALQNAFCLIDLARLQQDRAKIGLRTQRLHMISADCRFGNHYRFAGNALGLVEPCDRGEIARKMSMIGLFGVGGGDKRLTQSDGIVPAEFVPCKAGGIAGEIGRAGPAVGSTACPCGAEVLELRGIETKIGRPVIGRDEHLCGAIAQPCGLRSFFKCVESPARHGAALLDPFGRIYGSCQQRPRSRKPSVLPDPEAVQSVGGKAQHALGGAPVALNEQQRTQREPRTGEIEIVGRAGLRQAGFQTAGLIQDCRGRVQRPPIGQNLGFERFQGPLLLTG